MYLHRTRFAALAALGLSLSVGYATVASAAPGTAIGNRAVLADSKTGVVTVDYKWTRRSYCRRGVYWRGSTYGNWDRRRNAGPPYGRRFMNCINSGHPADFCRAVGWHFESE
jgi:hypothetical protein